MGGNPGRLESRSHRTAFLALGSNLGDRLAALEGACAMLREEPDVEIVARSRVYETSPVGGPPDQGPYLNAVIAIRTRLTPDELLERAQAIEQRWGRQRSVPNAPRTLDVDLLMYDDAVIDSPRLQLPHPRMHARRFVLAPLAEIAPEQRHSVTQQTVQQLLANLPPDEEHATPLPGGGWTDEL